MGGQNKVTLALIGTGTFVKDAYVPLLERFANDIEVKAVWSRRQESSQQLCAQGTDVLSKATALSGDSGFEEIISDQGIDAVLIVLPAYVVGQYIEGALNRGRMVLSEKPVSESLATSERLIKTWRDLPKPPVWFVAENYRFETVFLDAAAVVPRLGQCIKIDLVADLPMNTSNKYFASDWRRDTSLLPGGFMADTSVHYMASLRMMADAAGAGKPTTMKSFNRFMDTGLNPPDTAVACMQWESGLIATISFCMASTQPRYSLTVTGTHGTLEVSRAGWQGTRSEYVLTYRMADDESPTVKKYTFHGLDNELQAFLRVVDAAKKAPAEEDRGTPEQAFNDLALVTALLDSGKTDSSVQIASL